jgi:Fe-S cluster assembly protein SufD
MSSAQLQPGNRAPEAARLEALVRSASGSSEPKWMGAFRQRHLLRFAEVPPSFGRYSRMKLDWPSLPAKPPLFGGGPPPAGGLEVLGAAQPGRFSPLSRSLPALGEEGLSAHFPAAGPWESFVLAGWTEGGWVRWGKGERGSLPAYLRMENRGGLVLEPLLIQVEEGAEASLVLHWVGGEEPAFHLSAVSARVAPEASLKIFLLHEGGGAHHHLDLRVEVGGGASSQLFGAWVGGKWSLGRIHADMPQAGGSWSESHVVVTSGREHADLDTQVRHLSHHTASDVRVRTVADGASRAIFTGNILMDERSENGQAFLSDHVLLLSPEARADSIPGLEIKAQEVRAAHQASVSPVDEEQLFYLGSRGLEPGKARHLIVVGFLESLFERACLDIIPDVLDPILEERVAP